MGREDRHSEDRRRQIHVNAAAFTKIIDRFGRLITPGAQVVYKAPIDLAYTVVAVTPILDPRAQTGLHEIKLLCEVTLPAMDRLPVDLIIVVAHPRMAADQAADNGDQRAEAETPPAASAPGPTLVLPPGTAIDAAEDPAAPGGPDAPPKLDDEP